MSVVLSVPAAAAAQSEVPDWARKVRLGSRVFVTNAAGETVDGAATEINGTSMVVSTRSGPLTVAMTDIAKVQKPDGAGNGAMTGALAGLGVGVLSAVTSDCGSDPWSIAGDVCEAVGLAGIVVLPFVGAAVGWAIDAAVKGRETIFDAKRDRRGRRVTLGLGPRTIQARIAF